MVSTACSSPSSVLAAELHETHPPATGAATDNEWDTENMMKIIGVLLIVWLVVAILGAVIKGLFWLTVLGAVLFVATAAYGYLRRRSAAP